MAQVGVNVHRGMAQMKFSAAQTKPWIGSPPLLPGNTILLPALQMLQAFPAGADQAHRGNYDTHTKKTQKTTNRKRKMTACCKQVGKWGMREGGGSTFVSAPFTVHIQL